MSETDSIWLVTRSTDDDRNFLREKYTGIKAVLINSLREFIIDCNGADINEEDMDISVMEFRNGTEIIAIGTSCSPDGTIWSGRAHALRIDTLQEFSWN